MRLIVGLGNPGPEYARNRHNVGFMAADAIVRRHRFSPWRAKFAGEIAEGELAGERVLVLKPMTYMNDSGSSVAAAARFFKVPVGDVIVLHDEIDLAPGKVRIKKGGGHAAQRVAQHRRPHGLGLSPRAHRRRPSAIPTGWRITLDSKAERDEWVETLIGRWPNSAAAARARAGS